MPKATESVITSAVKEHNKGLFHFIRKRVKTNEDAEDILQDVWHQLSMVINAAPIEQVSAWLYRVAKNRIIDRYRKRSEEALDDTADDEDDDFDFKEILLTEATTPETEYLRSLFWQQLYTALNELPEEQKQVFVWHELEDISFEDIAILTGEKVNTLISRKHYAIKHLRKRLKQLYIEITQN